MYPFNLKIRERTILFIGGGEVSTRKILSLLPYGAKITVISPTLTPSLQELADNGSILWLRRVVNKCDINKDYLIIFCYTNSVDVNNAITTLALEQDILLSAANNAERSTIHMPAVCSYEDVTISVNSGNPKRSQSVRDKIKKYIESVSI